MTSYNSNVHSPPLYIALISVHGLIRGDARLELGCDADTGEQAQYVLNLMRALANYNQSIRVDLLTRRIVDSKVHKDYARPIEPLSLNSRIIRIDAGPEEYIPKEALWDHLDTFVEKALAWLSIQPRMPDFIHSHYADAGYVGVQLSKLTGMPLLHTCHSLGRSKHQKCYVNGFEHQTAEQKYNLQHRVSVEENIFANVNQIVKSTHYEVNAHYEMYDYFNAEYVSSILPGIDTKKFRAPKLGDPTLPIAKTLKRFLNTPNKPIILSISTPGTSNNITHLIKAYGESLALQELANLLIITGERVDIREMETNAQSLMTDILLLTDYYDLYGKIAFPKNTQTEDVADIYRHAATTGGLFVGTALSEPFEMSLLEATISGLPLIAPNAEKTTELIMNCQNGLLVNPHNPREIGDAIFETLTNKENWRIYAKNGIENIGKYYSWQAHAENYLNTIMPLVKKHQIALLRASSTAIFEPETMNENTSSLLFCTDLDRTLLPNGHHSESPQARKIFKSLVARPEIKLVYASGRSKHLIEDAITEYNLPSPDHVIADVGTTIYSLSGAQWRRNTQWDVKIANEWKGLMNTDLHTVLTDIAALHLQEDNQQHPLKLSYYVAMTEDIYGLSTVIKERLKPLAIKTNIIWSIDELTDTRLLDIIPENAGKLHALQFLMQQLCFDENNTFFAGDSGNDLQALYSEIPSVLVANAIDEIREQALTHSKQFGNTKNLYLAKGGYMNMNGNYSAGVLEGLAHFYPVTQRWITEDRQHNRLS